MSGPPSRVYVARLAGLPVYDPNGDQVGKVRDVVVMLRQGTQPPRVLGLVVEVFTRRRIFLPMTRVTSVDAGHVITTGLVNMRRFEQRTTEVLVIGELLDRTVTIRESSTQATVFDLAMEQWRTRDWVLSKVAVTEGGKRFRRRRGQTHVLDWAEVSGFAQIEEGQGATHILAAFESMKPADLAGVLHELSPKRRKEIAAALDDERLADVLEELPEDVQVEILAGLDTERAADVLEEMSPDDAADLIAELPTETAERLLTLMEPDEAEDVRRLLTYEERTAGGLMTSEPVILPADATVADALAHVRNAELSPALAAMIYVCRPPLETPTGRFIGIGHIQRLLREPPSALVSGVLDTDLDGLRPDDSLHAVSKYLATYNLVAAPVLDEEGRLLGAVTVDDVLDHLLPDDWRGPDQQEVDHHAP
ncbi:magnesium transporter MgtE N-terminal domain-containing protein [Kribbella sp. CA-293567]|uniref:magnesium transporter MgtE N-terminal domain-containing protein n=1 Tax=Kribbella sp. CA-293567 TaxID=3002436 RepID=UPI0022DE0EC9|nr:CBS domain-containing protein [Kribbella sp. CA-293567]WBQ07014.1 CBS domain-containing protein [Kribbella sp. CA-293567]